MAEISGLSNSEVNELCKPADPATKVIMIVLLNKKTKRIKFWRARGSLSLSTSNEQIEKEK